MITVKEVLVGALLFTSCSPRPFCVALSDKGNPGSNTFNQNVSADPDENSIIAKTEALAFFSDDEHDEVDLSSPSVVSSSLLYEGGSAVSTEAITCHGGGVLPSRAEEVEFDVQTLDFDYDFEESDNDNDDDDDGHSLMLSNACFRRSRILSHGAPEPDEPPHSVPKNAAKKTSSPTHRDFGGQKAVLSLRGGGAATMGSEFAKRLLVAATVTLMYEAVLGHFFEFVKIVMQTSPQGVTYLDVIKTITAEKGVVGIWDGFVPWGVVQAVFKGGVFGLAHSMASSFLLPMAEEGILPEQLALTLAGGIGGGFQGYVLSPTLLLKTRVMTNPVFREKMSLIRTTWLSFRIGADVVAQEGLGALMKGSNVFATKRVFDWATRYFFADVFESVIQGRKGESALSASEKIAASLLAGTASTLSTLPLDVLVAKTQDAKKAGEKVSALTLFQADLQEKGWSGLYDSYMRGFEARLLHVCCTTVAMKVCSPLLYDYLFNKPSVQPM